MSDNIQRFNCKTRAGNTLSFFYNPDNDLLVIDLVHKDETGGNELVRKTLNEKALLKGTSKAEIQKERAKCLERAKKARDENNTTYNDWFFPRSDWQNDVSSGDTKLGYLDWLIHNLETAEVEGLE